jgi:hypothetical protein
MSQTPTLFFAEAETAIDEDAITRQLIRLIELCEAAGIDLDLLYNAAWFEYRGESDVEESG